MELRSEADYEIWRNQSVDHATGFIQALFSGGDSRIAADPITGLNKYLCPGVPAPDLVCLSSCTASPMSHQGFERAAEAFSNIASASSPRIQADRTAALIQQIEARLLRYFGIDAMAQVFLCPSGTDALLMTTMLLAAERPNEDMTAILPVASETGTGVPLATTGRRFDGPDSGTPLVGRSGKAVEIPLRSADGVPLSDDEVNDAFAAAAVSATGHVVVHITHGTKTGLIAPTSPPSSVDVVVDACQARIAPEEVAAHLQHGRPVVVTGSKFFGGPAFSGAVLFPRARLPSNGCRSVPDSGMLGIALRWTASLASLEAFEPLAAGGAKILADQAMAIELGLSSNPALVPVGGLQPRGNRWADQPSIFTFGVRDTADSRRLLSVAELRPLYERLARDGVLLGQPVGLGHFGGLRLAIGARDLLQGLDGGGLAHVFAILRDATTASRRLPHDVTG